MTAPSMVSGSPRGSRPGPSLYGTLALRPLPRRPAVGDAVPVEGIETGASLPGRLLWLASRLTIRPVLAVGSRVPHVRWPFGLIDFACRLLLPTPGTVR